MSGRHPLGPANAGTSKMNRTEKQQAIDDLNKIFSEHSGVFLFGFSGINVPDITELRRQISGSGSTYRVIKNRLAVRAAEKTALEALTEHFQGPTAMAFTASDPVALAKVVRDFAKDHPGLEFKAGVLERQVLSAKQVEQLAEMPSQEELIAKLLYLLRAPLTQLAGALQSPLRNLGSVLKQLAEAKQEKN